MTILHFQPTLIFLASNPQKLIHFFYPKRIFILPFKHKNISYMKTLSIICFFILSLTNNIIAQNKEKYPLGDYTELTDTKPHDSNTFWDKQGTLPQ